jgi:hypothetical protein
MTTYITILVAATPNENTPRKLEFFFHLVILSRKFVNFILSSGVSYGNVSIGVFVCCASGVVFI